MKTMVLYHAGCSDGFCAAWLFKQAIPDAEFIPVQHGTDPPDVTGAKVFIVDFSYKRDVMLRLAAQVVHPLVILDHHKTAQADLAGVEGDPGCGGGAFDITFHMAKSGARLAWEYLYSNAMLPADWLTTSNSGYSHGVAPWLVDYTEDRDLWAWKLPESREVNACLRSYPMDFQLWDMLHLRKPHDMAIEGSAILRRERQIVDAHVGFARELEIDGYKVLAVNATVLHSEIAGELAKGRPFGAAYFTRQDGRTVWSLRSTDSGIDVSEVARRHGGGGHRNAAGFEI